MKIKEEVFNLYKKLLEELEKKEIPEEEVEECMALVLIANLLTTLNAVEAPATAQALKVFAIKQLQEDEAISEEE